MLEKKISYRKAIYKALDRLLSTDGKVVLLGEDIGEYGGAFGVTGDLYRKHPSRVITTPISEGGFTGVAVGLSMTGFRPVLEIMFMDFMTLAMDQLINHAANIHYMYGGQLCCPLVVRTPAGGYRGYGVSHSKSLESLFIGIPGLKVVAPSTPADAFGCMLSAVYENNPVVFIEHKLLYNTDAAAFEEASAVPLGKARVARAGGDVTITAYSYGVHLSLRAAEELSKEGIEAEVIDLISLKPLDGDTIRASIEKTGRLVTVEEGSVTGGVGAEVVSLVAEESLHFLDGKIARVGKGDVPVPASVMAERRILPSAEDIVEAAKKTLSWR